MVHRPGIESIKRTLKERKEDTYEGQRHSIRGRAACNYISFLASLYWSRRNRSQQSNDNLKESNGDHREEWTEYLPKGHGKFKGESSVKIFIPVNSCYYYY